MMTPEVLEQEPLFESGVEALSDEGTPVSAVIDLARHPDGWAASMALVALERREDVPDEWVDAAIRALPRPSNCEDAFQLRAIARHADGRAIGRILGRTEGIYPGYVVDFVTARVEAGEHIDVDTFRGNVSAGQADELESYLDRIGGEMGDEVRAAFKEWRTLELFGSIGRVWQRPFDRPQALLAGRRSDVVDLVVAALTAAPRRSVILVGEHGAGKTALARAALDRIQDVTVFEATASQVIAGQVYRRGARRPRQAARGRDARPKHDLGDARAPGGAVRRSAHAQPSRAPRRPAAPRRVRLDDSPRRGDAHGARRPPGVPSAGHVGVRRHPRPLARPGRLDRRSLATRSSTTASTRRRTTRRSRGHTTSPSSSSRASHRRAGSSVSSTRPRSRRTSATRRSSTVATSSRPSRRRRGCRSRCSTPPLRSASRTSGRSSRSASCSSPTRSTCVVERIAMVKAGLTDPGRPLGVFLFLGPTGTGKTEIAKALAEFLFGSPDRLVRLDMSEFQTPGVARAAPVRTRRSTVAARG